jgi:hypothetical protein
MAEKTSLGTNDSVDSLIWVRACRMLITSPINRITASIGAAVSSITSSP